MRSATSGLRGLALGLTLATLAACGTGGAGSTGGGSGGGAAATAPVTISFWDTNAGPARTPCWQELIRRFEAANPNITVQYVGIPISQQLPKLQAAIASGAVPDVANPTTNYLSGLVAQQGLLPLDSRFATWSGRNDIPATVVQSIRSIVPDRKLYAVPVSSNTTTLYYRKDWIAQHNLKPPATWASFYQDVAALNDPTHGVYGFGLRGGSGSVGQVGGLSVGAVKG
jgi:multiple sugar transport system substrate-binding protein